MSVESTEKDAVVTQEPEKTENNQPIERLNISIRGSVGDSMPDSEEQ